MKTKAILTAILLLAAGVITRAENGWDIQASYNTSTNVTTFTISRTQNTSVAETVKYRFVNLSAYAGQHYYVSQVNGEDKTTVQQQTAALSGEFTFAAGENTSRTITVTESAANTDAYKYQTGTERSYKLEVTDIGGFYLTSNTRSFTTGSSFSSAKVSKSITNLVYFNSSGNFTSDVSSSKYVDVSYTPPTGQVETKDALKGYVLIDDSYDYANKPASVSTSTLINSTGAPASYLKNTLKYKIYATVCFTEKERDDGYQYVQIIAGNSSASYDGADSNGKIDNGPANSVYKACFELSDGSNAEGKAYFPHRGTTTSEFSLSTGKLWQQAFKSDDYNGSGSIVLDPTVSYITTRFDAGGDNDDTWGYKDFFVRMALIDATAPTVLAYSVAPGRHSRGNTVYVSVAFNEIVTSSSAKLTSNWGDLSYVDGSGSNVLTFSRTIPASPSSDLSITGFSGITDLAGNAPDSVTASGICSVDASYEYTITYNLNEGTVATANPTTYTYETATITLNNPTKTTYYFNGWTGSNGNTPNRSVTIAKYSHGNKSYTANWTQVWTGNGSSTTPYTITSTQGLDLLAEYVNSGTPHETLHFQLGGDITYTHTTDWNNSSSTENNYTRIGTDDHPFQGSFNGNNYTISGIRIYKGGVTYDADHQGLFGEVGSGGTVKRVNLSDARITGYHRTGGIAGTTFSCTIEDCTVGADVCIHAKIDNTYYHGGIVGNSQSPISRCISRATLTVANGSDYMDFGGIVGYTTHAITDCTAEGVVIPDVKGRGTVVGFNDGGTLTRNYYRACTVAGVANATGVGKGNSESSTETSDVTGAQPLYAVTLPEHASLVRTGGTSLPGSNNKTYTTGADIGGVPYARASATLNLSYDSSSIPSGSALSLFVKETSSGTTVPVTENGNNSYSFTMPAADVTVTASLLPIVSYIDADGTEKSHTCTPIESGTATYGSSENNEAWYYVTGEVHFDNRQLEFNDKAVHIIVCDGARLEVRRKTLSALYCPNGALTIYGQSQQSGIIIAEATGSSGSSGDGIHNGKGDISINGGNITATSESADGIVASYQGSIFINRGSVTATSGCTDSNKSAAGIRSHNRAVIINGGNVTATGIIGIKANDGITLGCATAADRITASSYGGTVTIASGQTLTDGSATYTGTLDASQIAAIAGKTLMKPLGPVSYIDENGQEQTCSSYTILSDATIPIDNNWGTIGTSNQDTWYVATGNYSFSNHYALKAKGHVHLILCDGATFTVTGNLYGIYASSLTIYGQSEGTGHLVARTTAENNAQGAISFTGTLTINGGHLSTGSKSGDGIVNANSSGCTLTINGGNVNATGAGKGINCDGNITLGWTRATDSIYASSYGYSGTITVKDGQAFSNGTEVLSGTITDMSKLNGQTLTPATNAIPYIDADGTTKYCAAYTVIKSSDTVFDSATGWYVVSGNVNVDYLTFNLSASGTVNLLLCDGANLNIGSGSGSLQFNSGDRVSTFAIYGQDAGSGSIEADRIDVVNAMSYTNFDINGGTINARLFSTTSGQKYQSAGITIRHGTVNAIATNTSGIFITNGDLTISGGNVTASSVGSEAAIFVSKANITISDGTVTATSIGGNAIWAEYGDLTISGGSVTAETSANRYSGLAANNLTISGGNVTARATGVDYSYGMSNSGSISLGWTKGSDSIYASSYSDYGTIKVKDGQTLSNGTEDLSGTITDLSKLNGKTLRPAPAASDATKPLTAHQADLSDVSRFWTTFYNPNWNYKLPAGAQAFILKSDKALYRVGDGTIVPAGCAVVIMADQSALTNIDTVYGFGTLTLTVTTDTAPAVSGNILLGTSVLTYCSSLVSGSQQVYVLGCDESVKIGFYIFDDSTIPIPANKAYYVE